MHTLGDGAVTCGVSIQQHPVHVGRRKAVLDPSHRLIRVYAKPEDTRRTVVDVTVIKNLHAGRSNKVSKQKTPHTEFRLNYTPRGIYRRDVDPDRGVRRENKTSDCIPLKLAKDTSSLSLNIHPGSIFPPCDLYRRKRERLESFSAGVQQFLTSNPPTRNGSKCLWCSNHLALWKW